MLVINVRKYFFTKIMPGNKDDKAMLDNFMSFHHGIVYKKSWCMIKIKPFVPVEVLKEYLNATKLVLKIELKNAS
jgi:hypothetical protein